MERDTQSELSDELEIRHLAASYSDAVNRMCPDDMANVYAEDGTLTFGLEPPIRGRRAICERFRRLILDERDFLFQMTHSGLIKLYGDEASSRWWFSEIKKPRGSDPEVVLGYYQDKLIREKGAWKFSDRAANGVFRAMMSPEGVSHTDVRLVQQWQKL